MQPRNAHPYSVRSQKDSLMGPRKYVVVRNPGGVRVSECPPSTQRRAWLDCDRLNVLHIAHSIHNECPGWCWAEYWQIARTRYLVNLPCGDRERQERIKAINAYTDADMPEPTPAVEG